MRIVLINAPLKSTVCDYSIGHQIPLGLLMVGGPLLDAGFEVTLLDAACDHLRDEKIVEYVCGARADVVMTSHVGSTQAHPCCVPMLSAIKAARPEVVTVYGGVHPTYHDKEILAEHSEVDIIVRGEGEVTALELVQALADKSALADVQGISWRSGGMVVRNRQRPPIETLGPTVLAGNSFKIGENTMRSGAAGRRWCSSHGVVLTRARIAASGCFGSAGGISGCPILWTKWRCCTATTV